MVTAAAALVVVVRLDPTPAILSAPAPMRWPAWRASNYTKVMPRWNLHATSYEP